MKKNLKSKPSKVWKGVEVVVCSKNFSSGGLLFDIISYFRGLFNVFCGNCFLVTFVTNEKKSSDIRYNINHLTDVTSYLLQVFLLQFVTFCYNLLQSLLHFTKPS